MSALLFDIGGTSMRMAHGKNGEVAAVQKMATPHSPEEAVEAIAAYAHDKEISSVVGGVAGTIVNGVIEASPNLRAWEGFDFAQALRDALSIPANVQNDAELAGIGEAVYGAGKGYSQVAYLGIGTGIGGSLVHDGVLAPHAVGFEPGHQVLDVSTGETFEGLVSGHALEARYGEPAHLLSRSVYEENTAVLAAGIYNVLLAWSPEVLVLGGSLMNEENGYQLSAIEKAVQDIAHALPTVPAMRKALLRDSCGLFGALAVSEDR